MRDRSPSMAFQTEYGTRDCWNPRWPGHVNALSYGKSDLQALAASYAYGISRNHQFIDGNKRTAYVVCRTFLMLNGWDIVASPAERYKVFIGLAAGEISEDELAAWLRENSRPESVSEATGSYVERG